MAAIIVVLIVAIINGALPFVDNMLTGIISTALYAEQFMGNISGASGVTGLFNIFFGFGISLIVLKFLKKGFETYILWTDGDPDADPILLLTGFFKAMAVATCFPTLYDALAKVVQDLSDKVVTALTGSLSTSFSELVNGLTTAGIFTAIVSIVFFVSFFLLYFQFLKCGLEILILRIGLPLACVGLMDSDKGIFGAYIQKFFQSAATVVVQIGLAKLGVALMLNNHAFFGVAAVMLALSTPKFLSEFMIHSGGGGNLMGNAYQSVRLIQIVKGAFKA